MSKQEETLLEPTEEIEDEEYGSETGSNIEEDELTTVGGELPDINELETELAECVSVGFVVEENNETITIVSHITGDKEGTDIDGSLVLDKSWIKHREDLVIPYTPDFDITGTIQSWLEKRNA